MLAGERAAFVIGQLEALTNLGDEHSDDELMLLVDRFARVLIDGASSRLNLPGHVRAHLDALDGGIIFVVRVRDRIELWSKAYRESRLAHAERVFGDIP